MSLPIMWREAERTEIELGQAAEKRHIVLLAVRELLGCCSNAPDPQRFPMRAPR